MPRAERRRSRRSESHPPAIAQPRAVVGAALGTRAQRLYPLLVVGAVLAAYHNGFTTPFVFDDLGIPDARALHALSWRTVAGTSRPLVQLSLALNYAVGGLNVVGYHVVNVLVHGLAALTLFGIVARTLRTGRLGARWHDVAPQVALATSLIWAVHPLQTESVTYVIQRAESLMALFYLLTIYGVIRGAESAHPVRWYAATVVACGLGMLSKPVMATAPSTVLLYDRVFLAGSWAGVWRARAALHVALTATLMFLVLLLAGGANESATTAGFAMRDLTAFEYARSQPGVILHYLRLAFWPHELVLDYVWPVADGGQAVVTGIVLAGIVASLLWAVGRRSELAVLVLVFFIVLAPSSSVIPIKDLAFEHRMYLPLAPVVAMTVVGGWVLIQRSGLGVRAERRLAVGAAAAIVMTMTMLTVARNHDYRSAIAIWTDVVAKRPENARAHGNLAQALLQEAKIEQAIVELHTALRLDPANVDAHTNLGHALATGGDYPQAELHYAEALRLDPTSAEAHNNWGAALAEQERYADAEPHYVAALRLKPDYAEAHNNLGVALMQRGRLEDATAQYAEALHLRPDYVEAYSNLGNVLVRQGKLADAVNEYRRALQINPGYAQVHYNLALALAAQGQREKATAHAAEALRLRPDLEPIYRKSGLLQ